MPKIGNYRFRWAPQKQQWLSSGGEIKEKGGCLNFDQGGASLSTCGFAVITAGRGPTRVRASGHSKRSLRHSQLPRGILMTSRRDFGRWSKSLSEKAKDVARNPRLLSFLGRFLELEQTKFNAVQGFNKVGYCIHANLIKFYKVISGRPNDEY